MAELTSEEQMAAYSEAVASGLYAKRTGLTGKYDNVRRYWEDEITRSRLRGALLKLLKRSKGLMRRLRIMDLGCGSADGYELLGGIRYRDPDLQGHEVDILTPDVLGLYKGVDLNEDLLNQARALYGHNPKLVFEQADFTQGAPLASDEKPYDLYFTSFGTMSHHNRDASAVRLLADIARRVEHYAVIMCDWLGRYSYEWQTLWTHDPKQRRNMDYVVSYIYEKEEREAQRAELQHLNLRLMSRPEANDIITRASKRAGVTIRPLDFFDRSTLVGRHLDTQEYNPHARPLRKAVNSLHEANLRTDLHSLIFNYVPKPGFDFLNDYFEYLQMCWNRLVYYTADLLTAYDPKDERFGGDVPDIPASYPEPLRDMMARMRHVVEGVGWLHVGLPRENIIEPQLGYALRELVMALQQGQGSAHGLVGIFEVDRDDP
ncbi:MAG: class I SAM-dependent methyltransferase [Candidatus Brocadiae bacterium]|nr:class I SAM-dependent methyltransferase [Candidatus Brocadiia bacterium]